MADLLSSPARRGSPFAGMSAIHPRALVLLAGGLQTTSLASEVGRSVLDLPLTTSLRLLGVWRARIRELAPPAGVEGPQVLILVAPSTPPLVGVDRGERSSMRVEPDAGAYRGTAGVLRDLCVGYAPEDHVLVGTASQCPEEDQIRALLVRADPADGVTLAVGPGGEPTGLILLRCGALSDVPAVGYIDLKEQALPRIAAKWRVRAVPTVGIASRPIRDVEGYVDSVRCWHRFGNLAGPRGRGAFEERWKPAFRLVEEGALVDPTARIHDSVVLSGGTVEAGAEVVRSVVGPGGTVRRKERVVGGLVLAARQARASGRRGGAGAGAS
jgi:hypothetical protein